MLWDSEAKGPGQGGEGGGTYLPWTRVIIHSEVETLITDFLGGKSHKAMQLVQHQNSKKTAKKYFFLCRWSITIGFELSDTFGRYKKSKISPPLCWHCSVLPTSLLAELRLNTSCSPLLVFLLSFVGGSRMPLHVSWRGLISGAIQQTVGLL